MISIDSVSKSRDITLPTKVCIVKAMIFPVDMFGGESWTIKKADWKLMLSNCGTREDSGESLGLQGDQICQSWRKSTPNIQWKVCCSSRSSKTLATWWEELTGWKRCWERLRARGERDDRERDGWIASLTQWTWIWANSGRWWRTGKPGVQQLMDCKESETT